MVNKDVKYAWPYLKQVEHRGKVLFSYIKDHISECKTVFDFNCGYAPLYSHLSHLVYRGFDKDKECIKFLKRKYPKGIWKVADDKRLGVRGCAIDLFLYLGMTDGYNKVDSKTELESAVRMADKVRPLFVLVEMSQRVREYRWLAFTGYLIEANYKRVRSMEIYDANLEVNSQRRMALYKRNYDYSTGHKNN